jgi:hypothetical protein
MPRSGTGMPATNTLVNYTIALFDQGDREPRKVLEIGSRVAVEVKEWYNAVTITHMEVFALMARGRRGRFTRTVVYVLSAIVALSMIIGLLGPVLVREPRRPTPTPLPTWTPTREWTPTPTLTPTLTPTRWSPKEIPVPTSTQGPAS